MLSTNKDYQQKVYHKLLWEYKQDFLPINHIQYLEKMKKEFGFEPKVCYDIGSCVLHWTRHAERIWNNCEVILFDAFEPVKIFYKNHRHHIGVLADQNDKQVKFYQNDVIFGGNSIYKENNDTVFPETNYMIKETKTLDTVVDEKSYPLPDLIKMDVQGSELDILKGATKVLSHAKYLIVELQSVHYNKDAPLANVTIDYLEKLGWELIAPKFQDNGPDADYCFVNRKLFHELSKKKNVRKKLLILHGIPCHYEMLPSILVHFQNFEIDILSCTSPDIYDWASHFLNKLNIQFNMIVNFRMLKNIQDKKYDLCILPTDDDYLMSILYDNALDSIPLYVINHARGEGIRSKIHSPQKYALDIHGIQNRNQPFHFCGVDFISVNDKMKLLSKPRISVAILGGLAGEEENFLSDLKRRIKNFEDIDFYIINRFPVYWMSEGAKHSNIHFFIQCTTATMFEILKRCHYMYFFAHKRGSVNTCSACFGMSYSFLCRLVCDTKRMEQYEIKTPLFKDMDEQFELQCLSEKEVYEMEQERRELISKTSDNIKTLLPNV